MKRTCVLLTVTVCLLFTGCGTDYRVQEIINTSKTANAPWTTERRSVLHPFEQRYYINPYTYNPQGTGPSLFATASCTTNDFAAKTARNRLQDAIISLSDDEVNQHLADLKATQNNVNLFLGGAAIGTAAGAGVAAPVAAKVLATTSAGLGGFRALFSEQVYQNALVDSLVTTIETARSQFLADIIRTNQQKSVQLYTVEAAITEAKEYHHMGSFYFGLAKMKETIDAENHQTQQNVSKTRGGGADTSGKPRITIQPQGVSVAANGSASFLVVASGTGPLSYHWSFDGESIARQTNLVLILSNVQTTNAGNYNVVVSNSLGAVTSSNAVLTVTTK